jgi:hypothetical protein
MIHIAYTAGSTMVDLCRWHPLHWRSNNAFWEVDTLRNGFISFAFAVVDDFGSLVRVDGFIPSDE